MYSGPRVDLIDKLFAMMWRQAVPKCWTAFLLLLLLSCRTSHSLGADASKPIAHWTFDQLQGDKWPDQSGHDHNASPDAQTMGSPIPGLLNGAVRFEGKHRLAVPKHPDFTDLEHVAFSVWVRPDRFDHYNEIFRKEDGGNRLLFSFQENGSILSLGLNVGGYVECDATIDPALLLDGLWHHCAATFDGRTMRVYLDGREVGSLDRSGTITSGGAALACIGSSNGGECFQGAMDDLRIYSAALSADQIGKLYDPGRQAQLQRIREQEEALAQIYVSKDTFAGSLAAARRRFVESNVAIEPPMAAAMARRVAADFPDEVRRFASYTGLSPAAYVRGTDEEVHCQPLERLVALMTEYRPLTEHQIKRMTDDERHKWAEVTDLELQAEELLAADASLAYSSQWIDLMLAAGSRIDFRPVEREAVAPYVPPYTPPTRTRSAAEAGELLRRDWLYQADGRPLRPTHASGDRLDSRTGSTHCRRLSRASRFQRAVEDLGPPSTAGGGTPGRKRGVVLQRSPDQTIDRAGQPGA